MRTNLLILFILLSSRPYAQDTPVPVGINWLPADKYCVGADLRDHPSRNFAMHDRELQVMKGEKILNDEFFLSRLKANHELNKRWKKDKISDDELFVVYSFVPKEFECKKFKKQKKKSWVEGNPRNWYLLKNYPWEYIGKICLSRNFGNEMNCDYQPFYRDQNKRVQSYIYRGHLKKEKKEIDKKGLREVLIYSFGQFFNEYELELLEQGKKLPKYFKYQVKNLDVRRGAGGLIYNFSNEEQTLFCVHKVEGKFQFSMQNNNPIHCGRDDILRIPRNREVIIYFPPKKD